MKLYLYTLNPDRARPISLKSLRRVVKKACNYVEKSSNYQVKFEEDNGQGRLANTPIIDFSFADFADSTDTATWEYIGNNKFKVLFNYHLSWATWFLEPFWGKNFDLYTYAVHELGHVLGMYPMRKNNEDYHNPDPSSVMHSNPVFSKFTKSDLGMLIYLTNPKNLR